MWECGVCGFGDFIGYFLLWVFIWYLEYGGYFVYYGKWININMVGNFDIKWEDIMGYRY